MAAQALGAAAVTTGILMAVPGAGPSSAHRWRPVPSLPHNTPHRASRRHPGGHRRPTQGDSRRIHSEARRAIEQCVRQTHKPRHYTPAALLYARNHLPTEAIEYTDCPEQLTHELLHTISRDPRRHRSPHPRRADHRKQSH